MSESPPHPFPSLDVCQSLGNRHRGGTGSQHGLDGKYSVRDGCRRWTVEEVQAVGGCGVVNEFLELVERRRDGDVDCTK